MQSTTGMSGLGAVPGLAGWHAVNVTNAAGEVASALVTMIRGARVNAMSDAVRQHFLHGALMAGISAMSTAEGALDFQRRIADRQAREVSPREGHDAGLRDRVDRARRSGANDGVGAASAEQDGGSALHWHDADRVVTLGAHALRHHVCVALDDLQNRYAADQGETTVPLALAYFQQDQDLTPDAALAVSLAAAASPAPRSDTLSDALGHMLSLSASTTPATRSMLRQVDDGRTPFWHEGVADASAVAHRTLRRALQLLTEQQGSVPAERHTPLREVCAAFDPSRIAPFEGGVRVGLARHWSGTIAAVRTASSFTATVTPAEHADPFLRNMLEQLPRDAAARRSAVGGGALSRRLDPAFVAEAAFASIGIRDGQDARSPATFDAWPPSSQAIASPISAGAVDARASALFARLLALCGGDEAVLQVLSHRMHQSSLLAATSPVLAQYAHGDDPQVLLLPGSSGPGRDQFVVLGDAPLFHVDVWADAAGGVCADGEVKWPITQYGAAEDAYGAGAGRRAVVPALAEWHVPSAPSWLQIRRVVHAGRDEEPEGIAAMPSAGAVRLTYGVSHMVCEIAHHMTFNADTGALV
ncbi:hypothetical protein ACQUFY_15410 [Robbsia andropogonis]|uniref:hypothetical protein n=1 Tax=Robbsia andropogonis TaxID=28092 RepID=UPI000698109F|nr:hypothetical protein [Robbsia andropogonis]